MLAKFVKKTSWVQLVIFTGIVLFGHLAIFIFSSKLPESTYFELDADKIRKWEQIRTASAESALRTYRSALPGIKFNQNSAKRLCVGMISVNRKQLYLRDSIASILARTPLKYQDQIHFTLYNVNEPPQGNIQANGLSDVVKVKYLSYKLADPRSQNPRVKVKEFLDYINVLDDAYKNNCEYYLILEDDIVASVNWAEEIMKILDRLDSQKDPWLFVKLFVSFQFFNWKPHDWWKIGLIAAAFTLLVYGVFIGFVKLFNIEALGSFDILTVVVFFAGSVSLVLVLGRWTVIPPPKGLSEASLGAFTQANLYSRTSLGHFRDGMMNMYNEHKAVNRLERLPPKDTIIEEVIEDSKVDYKELIHTPSLFQHTGIKSSIGNDRTAYSALVSHSFPDDDVPVKVDLKWLKQV